MQQKAYYLNLSGKEMRLTIGRGHRVLVKPGINHLPVKVYEMHPTLLKEVSEAAAGVKPSFRTEDKPVVEEAKTEEAAQEDSSEKQESAVADATDMLPDENDPKAIRQYLKDAGAPVKGYASLEKLQRCLAEFLDN